MADANKGLTSSCTTAAAGSIDEMGLGGTAVACILHDDDTVVDSSLVSDMREAESSSTFIRFASGGTSLLLPPIGAGLLLLPPFGVFMISD